MTPVPGQDEAGTTGSDVVGSFITHAWPNLRPDEAAPSLLGLPLGHDQWESRHDGP